MAIMHIPVVKAKGKFVSIDTGKNATHPIPDEVYEYALYLGLKAIINRGTTDLKVELFPNADAYVAEAMKIAHTQLELLLEGKTRKDGMGSVSAASKKDPVHVEARRLAILYAKEQTRSLHPEIKISMVSAKQWGETADAYIAADTETWYAAARESIAKAAVRPKAGVDFVPVEDPTLVKKAAEKKAVKAAEKKVAAAAKPAKPKAPAKAAKPKPGATA